MTTVNPRLIPITQKILRQTSMFSTVQIQFDATTGLPSSDGTYVNIITGHKTSNFQDALTHAMGLGIEDLREINKEGIVAAGSRATGVDVAADRVIKVNEYIKNTANRAALEAAGLGHLVGGDVSGMMILFNTDNKKAVAKKIGDVIKNSVAGEYVLTDGGIQLFSLSKGLTSSGRAISLTISQQETLKGLSGTSILSDDIVSTFLGNLSRAKVGSTEEKELALQSLGQQMGKLSKRIQSLMSPRNVSYSSAELQAISDGSGIGVASIVDEVESILKTAGGGYQNVSDLEKLFIGSIVDSADVVDDLFSRGTLGHDGVEISGSAFSFKEPGSAADEALKVIEKSLQLRGADGEISLGAAVEARTT